MMTQRSSAADAHVDVLWRMDHEGHLFYGQESPLQASYTRLVEGGVTTQVFALYVSTSMPGPVQLESVLRSIDIFQQQVSRPGFVRLVRDKADLEAARENGEIAGLLSLEGVGCLCGNPSLIRVLFNLGVRGAGLTWNPANAFADGCGEPRGAGLTGAGHALVQEMERLGMWIDIAHLADAGVYDILHTVSGPIMASHANVRRVHDHPRNLTDEAIQEIISRDGWIGLTFEGSFVESQVPATIDGVFRHLDHILHLGGERCVGFGSDFDGTAHPVQGLANASDYQNLADRIVKRYGEKLGRNILSLNFERFLAKQLPNAISKA